MGGIVTIVTEQVSTLVTGMKGNFKITAEELITGAERYETGGSVLRYISEPATRSYAAKDKDEQEIISIMESITEKGIGYLLHAAREASRQFSKDQPKGAASSSP
jgi:hypothetical protein